MLGFAVALAIVVAIGALTIQFLRDNKEDDLAVEHTHYVIETLQYCLLAERTLETYARSFILTGSEASLATYSAAVPMLLESLRTIQRMTADNPEEQRHMLVLRPMILESLEVRARVLEARRREGQQAAIAILFQHKVLPLTNGIHQIIGEMRSAERTLLKSRMEGHDRSSHRLLVIILFGFTAAIGFLGAASWVVHMDARARERVEQELQLSNRELESFSYSVSHDLRAPLRGIEGFSQLILENYKDSMEAQGQEYFKRISEATRRMGLLIDEILELSRITRAPLQLEDIDLAALARTVAEELRKSDPSRRVNFRIPPSLPARADAALLGIALTNLLSNAWKFTGQKAEGNITLGKLAQAGKTVYYVRDNGAGFDMAYKSKLFQAFQRLHSQKEFPGSGIGLATVARVVRRHGGRVWAEATVNQGATFYFTLT